MVVNKEGIFVTARTFPKLATINVEIVDEGLRLTATGLKPFTLKTPPVLSRPQSCV